MVHLFLFDSRLGGEANPEQKILFFHPASVPLATQTSSVGLCEAVAGFCSTFSSGNIEVLHMAGGRQVALQAEPHIWIVLFVANAGGNASSSGKAATAISGATTAASSSSSASSGRSDKEGQSPDELPVNEESLQDCTLQALVQRIYSTLSLVVGPLSAVATARGADGLRALLSQVMPLLVRFVVPTGEDDGRRLDLLDTIEAMRLLPLDRKLALRVQYLLNLVQTSVPAVRHLLLLQGDQLVWSTLTRDATIALHRVAAGLAAPSLPERAKGDAEPPPPRPDSLPDEALVLASALLQRRFRSVARAPPPAGSFLCGHADATQDGNSALEQTSLALLVDEACAAQWTQPLWYEQLRSLLLPELQPLAAALLDAHGRMGAVEDPHRFIYFNRSNLKSSIKPTKYGLSGRLGLHAEPRALLNRMHADLTDGGEGVREVALQTPGSHGWLVGRTNGTRTRGFYLVVDGRDCTWSEVNQEVQALCAAHFSSIFDLDG